MDRTTLVELLDPRWATDSACRQALLGGAPFNFSEHEPTPVDDLVATYRVRERTTTEAGISTPGFAEALLRLQTSGLEKVRIGSVNDLDHRRSFVCFVAADGSRIVSCIGVSQRCG
ncbi:hypothetical protein [Actinoallomurus sp. CA-142502]|uniref:hypothetical protein n=1 Tax=Actinoallomurus sp. CA-142502 TaxID=3239885 RepID=UPI003D907CB6